MNSFLQSTFGKQYSLFVGRWQPWHDGHRWLIDTRLNEGKNVWIAIRNVAPDENNPFTSTEVMTNIVSNLREFVESGRIVVSIIPDIESINYGRGVGYDIIEHIPPSDIHNISATNIRNRLREEGKL